MTRNQLVLPDSIVKSISERSRLQSSFASARSVGSDYEKTSRQVDLDGPTTRAHPNDNAPHLEVKRATNKLTEILSEIESTESQIKATRNEIVRTRDQGRKSKMLVGLVAALILFILLAVLAV